jgi:hypothetical protein
MDEDYRQAIFERIEPSAKVGKTKAQQVLGIGLATCELDSGVANASRRQ